MVYISLKFRKEMRNVFLFLFFLFLCLHDKKCSECHFKIMSFLSFPNMSANNVYPNK